MKRLKSGKVQDYIYLGKKDDGTEIRKYASAATEKQLQRKLNDLRRQYDRGDLALRDMTVKELADAWLANKTGILESTRRNYTKAHEYVCEALGGRRASQVRSMHIRAMLTEYKPSVAAYLLSATSSIFEMGAENGAVIRNPCKGVRTAYKPKRREAVTPADLDALAKASLLPEDRLFVNLMLYAGLRVSEAVALRPIDVENGMIHVRRIIDTFVNQYAERTKTEAGNRLVPIPEQIAEILPEGNRFMPYIQRANGEIMTSAAIRSRWARITRAWNHAAGGTYLITAIGHYTCHSMRHSYATMLALMGVLPDTLQYRLGHEDVHISYNVYSHANKLSHLKEKYRPHFPRYGGGAEVKPEVEEM